MDCDNMNGLIMEIVVVSFAGKGRMIPDRTIKLHCISAGRSCKVT